MFCWASRFEALSEIRCVHCKSVSAQLPGRAFSSSGSNSAQNPDLVLARRLAECRVLAEAWPYFVFPGLWQQRKSGVCSGERPVRCLQFIFLLYVLSTSYLSLY